MGKAVARNCSNDPPHIHKKGVCPVYGCGVCKYCPMTSVKCKDYHIGQNNRTKFNHSIAKAAAVTSEHRRQLLKNKNKEATPSTSKANSVSNSALNQHHNLKKDIEHNCWCSVKLNNFPLFLL